MSNIFPSVAIVHPSYVMSEIIMQFEQPSGCWDLLAGRGPMVRLSEGDLYAYAPTLQVRTKSAAAQAAANQLPSSTLQAQMISVPSYLLRTRSEYDHHDVAAASRWKVSLPEAQRLASRQSIANQARVLVLYGFNAANGEGLANTPNATSTSLPPDSNGNDTVQTYDNGQMAIFLLGVVSAMMTRTNQTGMPQRICFLSPQRIINQFSFQNIVQLTQFQRPGAGTETTFGVLKGQAGEADVVIEWAVDDTLIGQGNGGTDLVIVTMPELKVPKGRPINTNEFAELQPGLTGTCLQLADMAAPREIPTPIAGGAVDNLFEMRMTPGWGVRPEAVTLLSMPY